MKILVTGATGFIGDYVVQGLLKRNHQIITTSSDSVKAKKKSWFDKTIYIEHDINKITNENLFEKFQQPDIVIHLAWGNLNDFKSSLHVESELPKHLAFLKNLIANGLKDLTCIGTCLEYGLQEGELNEEMESNPIIAYPIAKNILRKELESLQLKHTFSLKWIRLFYLYGEGQSPKSILQLLENALQKNKPEFNMSLGEQVRDYLPVTDVAENIIIFALQKKVGGIINCCSGVPISIKSLVENYLIKKQKSIKLNLGYYPYTDYEPMKFWGDNSKQTKIISMNSVQ